MTKTCLALFVFCVLMTAGMAFAATDTGPVTLACTAAAPAELAGAQLGTPEPLLAASCEARLWCEYPWTGYLYCTGEAYCLSGDNWVDCDGYVQECECGLMPPIGYCP